MSVYLQRLLAGLGTMGALLLVLAAAGLLPPAEPEPPTVEQFAVEKAIVPESRVLAPVREPDAGATRGTLALRFLPLCAAPDEGARLFKLRLFASSDALLVWCKQGYELFWVGERGGELTLTRAARFKARGELSGGAASGDFDGDGQRDLVLGVAARAGVVHRSGAGVFWLRGRAQGGFEPARILAEISPVAVAGYAREAGVAEELFVLTAGDVAAQRAGELWLFAREPSLSRQRVLPAGLLPRGLVVRASSTQGRVDVFVLTGQPGRLTRTTLELATRAPVAEPIGVELRGAQAFAHEPSFGDAVFLRDATNLYRAEGASAVSLVPFARDAQVGPFALTDLSSDRKPEALAAVETGVAWLSEGAPPAELMLPSELKVLDVESVRVGESALAPVALVRGRPDADTLSLLVLPAPPWPVARGSSAAGLSLREATLEPGQSPAEVALE